MGVPAAQSRISSRATAPRPGRPAPLWKELARLADRIRSARSLRVACDFDGTLTGIVAHPDQAAFPERARQALARLGGRPRVRLAVLSGRMLEDVARNIDLPGVFFAGQAGLETRDAGGRYRVHVAPHERLPAGLRREMALWCERFPGAWLEDKRLSIALHYRAVEPARRPAFLDGVRRRIRRWAGRVTPVHGKHVMELMPGAGHDKATALRSWLGRGSAGDLLFFFGDDTNDEPAHAWVRARGGVSVAVGRSASHAEFALPSPREVTWFLEWLDREWAERLVGTAARGRPRRTGARG